MAIRPLSTLVGILLALIVMVGLFSLPSKVHAFDPVLVTYLEPTETFIPPDASFNDVLTMGSDKKITRVQVLGCLDGDTNFYPAQHVRGFNRPDIIIVSQTDPLPKGTMLQALSVSQCTDGDQLYNKVIAGSIPGPRDK